MPDYGNYSPVNALLISLVQTMGRLNTINMPIMVEYSEQDPSLPDGELPRLNVRQERIYSVGERNGVIVLSTEPLPADVES